MRHKREVAAQVQLLLNGCCTGTAGAQVHTAAAQKWLLQNNSFTGVTTEHVVLMFSRMVAANMVIHLTTNAKSCSDLAEIFSVASFIYLKNIIFYAFIFYLARLKSY
jgi:hypothetical protein